MNIVIGSDHRGFTHKEFLKNQSMIDNATIVWHDVGAYSRDRSDYPVYVVPVVTAVLNQQADMGILLCGSGVGMSMAANRFPGIYAALAWNEDIGRISREDDWANILVLPADFLTHQQALSIVSAWLRAQPKSGEYQERVAMIDRLMLQ